MQSGEYQRWVTILPTFGSLVSWQPKTASDFGWAAKPWTCFLFLFLYCKWFLLEKGHVLS